MFDLYSQKDHASPPSPIILYTHLLYFFTNEKIFC